jgi:hypothetical protein
MFFDFLVFSPVVQKIENFDLGEETLYNMPVECGLPNPSTVLNIPKVIFLINFSTNSKL